MLLVRHLEYLFIGAAGICGAVLNSLHDEIGVTHICLGTKDQDGVSFLTMGKQTLKLIEVERAQ